MHVATVHAHESEIFDILREFYARGAGDMT